MSITNFTFRNAVQFRSIYELKRRIFEYPEKTEEKEKDISEESQDPPRPPYRYCLNNMSATALVATQKRCHHSGRNTLQKHKNKYI